MSLLYVVYLIGFALLLAVAQIVLKTGAVLAKSEAEAGTILDLMFALVLQWRFWVAIAMCGGLVFAWAWLLTFLPLSKAYPFVVLAFIFAGVLEHFVFGQTLSLTFFLGCALIAAGLVVMI
ncbi:MAG TPA: hypothetical protein VMX97_09395 [Hyphomicrobiaceae bacterium]|nr:hypothetical protein [Hyphomicrobiaceae bacterium]